MSFISKVVGKYCRAEYFYKVAANKQVLPMAWHLKKVAQSLCKFLVELQILNLQLLAPLL